MRAKIKLIVVFAILLFALSFFIPKSRMQSKQIETAGQRFKNIKVLNEMPADQLGKVMNLMSASLGVSCSFCHVGDDFAAEGKKEKEISRRMIQMTFDLNRNNFGGRTEISCNTCHHGRARPQSAINLNPAHPLTKEEQSTQPEKKPTVEQILDKYTRAIGGRQNLAKITSRRITANRVEPNGEIEPEEIRQKGDKVLIVTKYSQATVFEAFDGSNAWKRANDFVVSLKPDESEQIKRNAQFFSFTDLKTIYRKMDFRAAEKINGRDVYLVAGVAADATGNRLEQLYFDAQSGFLIRRLSSVPTVLGEFQYRVDYADYQNFGGGVKLPATIRYAMPNISWTQKITKVENNADADDAGFKLN